MPEEKKRKREADGQGVKVGSVVTDPSVVVGSFAGIKVAENAKFDGYRNKNDFLIHGENEKMEYSGSSQDRNQFCIAVYDEKTKTVDLVPAPHVTVTSVVKARKAAQGDAIKQSNVKVRTCIQLALCIICVYRIFF